MIFLTSRRQLQKAVDLLDDRRSDISKWEVKQKRCEDTAVTDLYNFLFISVGILKSVYTWNNLSWTQLTVKSSTVLCFTNREDRSRKLLTTSNDYISVKSNVKRNRSGANMFVVPDLYHFYSVQWVHPVILDSGYN